MQTKNQPLIGIALVERYAIPRKALTNYLPRLGNYNVLVDAGSGKELIDKLNKSKTSAFDLHHRH